MKICSIVPESHSTFSLFDEAITIGVKKENAEASIEQVRMERFKYARVLLLSFQVLCTLSGCSIN